RAAGAAGRWGLQPEGQDGERALLAEAAVAELPVPAGVAPAHHARRGGVGERAAEVLAETDLLHPGVQAGDLGRDVGVGEGADAELADVVVAPALEVAAGGDGAAVGGARGDR